MPVKYVQIETTSLCNQRCVFCPVSTGPRRKMRMERATLEKILASLADHPVENIYLNGFNEPTHDARLPEWVALIREHGFNVHLNSNGSGLTPALAETLLAAGVGTININLSTLSMEKYRATRGNDDLTKVIPNVETLLDRVKGGATRVTVMVLGNLDAAHLEDIEAIDRRFAAGEPNLVICPIENYAGSQTRYLPHDIHVRELGGCMMNRFDEWLHFLPDGRALACCQDYAERHIAGDIHQQSASEIHQGEALRQLRRWVSGTETAPDDFLCRSCVFALSDVRARFCPRCVLPQTLGESRACGRCAVNGVV